MRLLFRPTGEPEAEELRLGVLRRFSSQLAALSGADLGPERILRAQVVMALGLGLATLRVSGVEPIASAEAAQVGPLLQRAIESLLGAT